MKKTFVCLLLSLLILFAGCQKKSDDSLSYIGDVLSSYSDITVTCGDVRFALSDGKADYTSPAILNGLTVYDGRAYYGDIETDVPDGAFYLSETLKNALGEFTLLAGRFEKDGNGAKYEGNEFDIYIDDPAAPKKMTVVSSGSEITYDIISINK